MTRPYIRRGFRIILAYDDVKPQAHILTHESQRKELYQTFPLQMIMQDEQGVRPAWTKFVREQHVPMDHYDQSRSEALIQHMKRYAENHPEPETVPKRLAYPCVIVRLAGAQHVVLIEKEPLVACRGNFDTFKDLFERELGSGRFLLLPHTPRMHLPSKRA